MKFFEVEKIQHKYFTNFLNMKFLLLIIFIHKCYLLKLENPGVKNEPPNQKINFLKKDENFRNNNKNLSKNLAKDFDLRKQDMGGRSFNTDFSTLKRDLKFFISKTTRCNVQVTDTVLFRKETEINFIEHWILHNNVEDIDPKSVTSNDVNIRYYTFNRKMNAFTVYFNFDENHSDKKEFTIIFQYDAVNLIKSYNNFPEGTDSDSFFIDAKDKIERDKLDNYNYNYNTFLWKLYNKNFPSVRMEYITIEINFDMGRDFGKYNIFSVDPKFNFKKIIQKNVFDEMTNVKYLWNGSVDSQEVLVMEIKFPLYFENCKYLNMNIIMVILGSIFIVFVILMLYIVFNSVMFNDL
jgi:hypothetical protein